MNNITETIFLVAFFRFQDDYNYGFKRIHLQCIFKTEEEARKRLSFCDEAGYYEGVLIEERRLGHEFFKGKRVWLMQQPDNSMLEIPEPSIFKHVINLIG